MLPRLGRGKTGLLIGVTVLLLIFAWYRGGEEPLRPISYGIAVPENAR